MQSGMQALETELKECRQALTECQSRVLEYLQSHGHQEAIYKTDNAQYKISVKTQKGVRSLKRCDLREDLVRAGMEIQDAQAINQLICDVYHPEPKKQTLHVQLRTPDTRAPPGR